MNKKLVAVAVAGVLAAPLAAEAQTANVTLYGRLNLTMEAVNGQAVDPNLPATAAPVNRTIYRVNSNSSRLGVRGSEALGGGLTAIFQIESSIVADASGGTLAGRETFVGLQGSWGTFKMGYFLSPYDDIHPIFGNVPTLTTSILSTAALWAQGSQNNDNGGYDNRNPNSIRYDSPRMAGFTASAQLSTMDASAATGGTDAQAKRHAYIGSLGGFYNNGPWQAGLAYERNQNVRATSTVDQAFSIAGGYNFGIARVAGVYERLDYDTPTGDLKRDLYGATVTFNLGPGQGYFGWIHGDKGKGSSADGTQVAGLVKGNDTKSDEFVVSYTYPLSKRTLTYVGYVTIVNDDNARYTFNINPVNQSAATGGLTGQGKPQGLVGGIVHFF